VSAREAATRLPDDRVARDKLVAPPSNDLIE
jgi:hypothetical protein